MNEQSYEYRTGQTQPAKSSRGLIAFLLICVIFLAGLVSLLGFLNIHLLGLLRKEEPGTPVFFAEDHTAPTVGDSLSLTVEGFRLQELPTLYQELYDLPAGLYVVDAPENSPVKPGDVLLTFASTPVPSLSLLHSLYYSHAVGEQIPLTFHREGETFSHTITISETQ